MREIRTLRATWRGLQTWCGSGPSGHTGAPALDSTQARQERGSRCGDDLRGGGHADHALGWRDEQIAADTARFRPPLQRVWFQLLGLAALAKSMSKILRFMMRAISSAGSGFWHSERGLSQKFDFGSKAKRSRAFAPRHDSGSVK